MFRIRRIYDDVTPEDKEAIRCAQEILKSQFPGLRRKEIEELPLKLRNPLKYRLRSILFVAEDSHGRIKGFALMYHENDLRFCYLDFISADKGSTGQGVGGALYSRVRQEALALKVIGIFAECLPDNPKLAPDAKIRRQNVSRLRFYERFGSLPIINTAYETPLSPQDTNPTYLMFDDLGQGTELPRDKAKVIVRAILERKYARICPASYINMVVDSFKDDPVRLRKPMYITETSRAAVKRTVPYDKRIILVAAGQPAIHHVQEKGYVEAPVEIESILRELDKLDIFHKVAASHFGEKRILAVHDKGLIAYLRKVCAGLDNGASIYPSVFPVRNRTRPPRALSIRAGYYCVDTFTPIGHNAYPAAKGSVDCALTAAKAALEGQRLAYALVSPPGHHAERSFFGGFCYINSAAVAAEYLSEYGKVAVLDIDYHHGNGLQDIFYERPDVLTLSIHCQPSITYPYFSGFASETGTEAGEGFNINIPLPEKITSEHYRQELRKALRRVARFKPRFLVVALGLDTATGDPTGTWNLEATDFEDNGRMIGLLQLPTVVVQEGGYDSKFIGVNAGHFFNGLWNGAYPVDTQRRPRRPALVR